MPRAFSCRGRGRPVCGDFRREPATPCWNAPRPNASRAWPRPVASLSRSCLNHRCRMFLRTTRCTNARRSDKGTRWTSRANSILPLIRDCSRCYRITLGDSPPVSRSPPPTSFLRTRPSPTPCAPISRSSAEEQETALGQADGISETHYVRLSRQSTIPPRKAAVAAALPERFGRYQIVRCLGRGAMGDVYLAEDTQLDRPVALKSPGSRTIATEN